MVDVHELLRRLRQTVPEVSADDTARALAGPDAPVLIDVRETEEWETGRLPGATHVPRGFLELQIAEVAPDPGRPVVVYCGAGTRSIFAAEALQRLGYRAVASLAGGVQAWKDAGHPVDVPATLSADARRRYARHLAIPEVGVEGQARLLRSRVLMIGAGGLGSPAALYLAAAGVGRLGIVDDDVVDETNLQRQVLHDTRRVGMPKTESARQALTALNPGLDVVPFRERLTSANVDRIFEGWDLVLDGCDNFPTRYLVNDACVKRRLPNVHGSVYRFEGQVTVFWPGRGPCYRCLFPQPPPPELAPSCAEAGVLGILPGVIGLLEAVEAIKILLGIGRPLVGRLLHYDALEQTLQEFAVDRREDCSVCADGVEFPGYVDYEHFCRSAGRE